MSPSKPSFDLDTEHKGGDNRPLPDGAETGDEIDEMFEHAFARAPDNAFLVSIHTWWEEKGFLTQGQYQSLYKYTGD